MIFADNKKHKHILSNLRCLVIKNIKHNAAHKIKKISNVGYKMCKSECSLTIMLSNKIKSTAENITIQYITALYLSSTVILFFTLPPPY